MNIEEQNLESEYNPFGCIAVIILFFGMCLLAYLY